MRPSLHYRFGILDLEAERINVLCVDDDPALALEDGGAALAEGHGGVAVNTQINRRANLFAVEDLQRQADHSLAGDSRIPQRQGLGQRRSSAALRCRQACRYRR